MTAFGIGEYCEGKVRVHSIRARWSERVTPTQSVSMRPFSYSVQGVGAELLGDQAPELQTGASRKRSRKSPVISEHPSQHRKDVVSLVQHAADLEIAKTTAHEAQLQLRSQQAEEISALQHEHQQAIKRLEQGNRELSTQLQVQLPTGCGLPSPHTFLCHC